MGFWSNIFQAGNRTHSSPSPAPRPEIAVGSADDGEKIVMTFNNKNITYSGELADFDYNKVLRNKQENIQS